MKSVLVNVLLYILNKLVTVFIRFHNHKWVGNTFTAALDKKTYLETNILSIFTACFTSVVMRSEYF